MIVSVFSEYYFSVENLKSDTFLRHSMDVHGWVPVEVVCGFKRVRQLSVDEEAVIQVVVTEQYDVIHSMISCAQMLALYNKWFSCNRATVLYCISCENFKLILYDG